MAVDEAISVSVVATGSSRQTVDVADRLELLEGNVALIAASVSALTPVLAALNAELVRTGVVTAAEGLANQDELGAAASLTADALSAMPPWARHTIAVTSRAASVDGQIKRA